MGRCVMWFYHAAVSGVTTAAESTPAITYMFISCSGKPTAHPYKLMYGCAQETDGNKEFMCTSEIERGKGEGKTRDDVHL